MEYKYVTSLTKLEPDIRNIFSRNLPVLINTFEEEVEISDLRHGLLSLFVFLCFGFNFVFKFVDCSRSTLKTEYNI